MKTKYSILAAATLGYLASCSSGRPSNGAGDTSGSTSSDATGASTSNSGVGSASSAGASGTSTVASGTSGGATGTSTGPSGTTTGPSGASTGPSGTSTGPSGASTGPSGTNGSGTSGATTSDSSPTETTTGGSDPTSGETSDAPVGAGYAEHQGAGCDVTAGEYGVENAKLPNPFQMNDGTIIATMDEWQCRRAEIIKDLETYEVGPKPPPPEVKATYNGGMLSVDVTTPDGTITLTSNISGSGDCVIIGTAGGGLVNGCKSMAFNHDQVVKNDHSSGNAWPDDPYYTVYPDLWHEAPYDGTPITNGNDKIGNYSAWSWGVSRLIDGLELTKDQHGIDMSKIGVHGCSYGGKMALWAGALDQRIALTIAHESGGGGAPSWRTSEDYEQATGNEVEDIHSTNWGWFLDSMVTDNPARDPHKLPHDHHELIGLIAPRAFITLSGAPGNPWLGAHSEYISFMAARQVWKAMGVEDHAGLVAHEPQGGHCSASNDQKQAAQAFVNRFLLGQDVDTDIVEPKNANGDWEPMVDWEVPTIPNP